MVKLLTSGHVTFVAGYPVLRAAVAVEELGRWEAARSHDGPGHWDHL